MSHLLYPEQWTETEFDNGWEIVHDSLGEQEIVDIPPECPKCKGLPSIDFWWDVENTPHCGNCNPVGIKGEVRRLIADKLRAKNDANPRVIKHKQPHNPDWLEERE